MKNMESSQISKSMTETIDGRKNSLLIGQQEKVDIIFPLFDQIALYARFPEFLPIIFQMFFYVQSVMTSLWLFSDFYENLSGYRTTLYRYLTLVFWFQDTDDIENSTKYYFIFIALFTAISILILIAQVLIYKARRSFTKWTLYVTSFVISCCPTVLIIPTSAFCGFSFMELQSTNEGIYWAYLLLGIVCELVLIALFFISTSINAKSAILTDTCFNTFNASGVNYFAIINLIIILASQLLTVYPNYAQIILGILHVVLLGIIIPEFVYFPFRELFDNALICGVIVGEMVTDICMIIFNFISIIPEDIPLYILIACCIIATVVSFILMKRKYKSIRHELANSNDEMSDKDKSDYFNELNIMESDKKALMYLRVAFSTNSFYFIDGTLTNFIFRNILSTDSMCSLIQLISFFPFEIRKLNVIFKSITDHRNLGLFNRFLVYQVYKVKTLRSSNSSINSTNLICELHQLNEQSEANTSAFWSLQQPYIAFCETRAAEREKALLLWEEAMETYPNNSKIALEYSRFMTETMTDFEKAIIAYNRSDLIDNGNSFAVDNCFRMFIRHYPEYLKKGILDLKGNLVKKSFAKKGSQSSTSKSGGNSSSKSLTDITFDVELEETIGKKIFRNSRTRIALHHAISERTSKKVGAIKIASGTIFFIALAVFIGLYVFMTISFKSRKKATLLVHYLSQMRFLLGLGNLETIMRWGVVKGLIANTKLIGGDASINDIDKDFVEYMDITGNLPEQIMKLIIEARTIDIAFILELATESEDGKDVYAMSSCQLANTLTVKYCKDNKVTNTAAMTFKDKHMYQLYLQANISGLTDNIVKDKLLENDEYCELVANSYDTHNDTQMMYDTLISESLNDGNSLDKIIRILLYFVPASAILVCFIPMLTINFMYIHEINVILNCLRDLPPEAKASAVQPIRAESEEAEQTSAQATSTHTGTIYILLGYFIFTIALLCMSLLSLLQMKNSNTDINTFTNWYMQSAARYTLSAELGFDLAATMLITEDIGTTYLNRTFSKEMAKRELNKIQEANSKLLQGHDDVKACYGEDTELDNLHLAERCELTGNANNIHDTYRCSSLNQQFEIFKEMALDIITNPEKSGGKIADESSLNEIHILTRHLFDSFKKANDRINTLVSLEYSSLNELINIFLVLAIIIALLDLVLTAYYVNYINRTYKVITSLIKHVAPVHIVASKDLMNVLLNRTSKSDDRSMGISQSIIYNSADAILCTGLNGVIEIVNPAVSYILGYTPDQLLGQQISSFFHPEAAPKVQKQLELMANGQSAPVHEDHMTCLSDSSAEVQFQTTIIGMKSEGSDNISSFVFLLTDETELLKQQKEAEEAKAKSEKLLYQILPKDVVVRLNRGEKDISFSIPHATIIFIDIVKFSDYSANLSPQEIMRNLSLVFATFDENISKYPRITKIKLIGDVYMAAAGLFGNPDDPPNGHAEETVKFGLDCISELDTINIKLNSSLEVRVGVNTGGPLIAGVLGTDKPLFDIIGDPINIAARLQSTDIPMHVQISNATKELIENCNFAIEERGEVFLKGKGKQMTYLVAPNNNFMSQFSTSMSMDQPKQTAQTPHNL